MARYNEVLRVALVVGGAALVAAGLRIANEKRSIAHATTTQIEDAIAALDPVTRADVIARLTVDAAEQIKERLGH